MVWKEVIQLACNKKRKIVVVKGSIGDYFWRPREKKATNGIGMEVRFRCSYGLSWSNLFAADPAFLRHGFSEVKFSPECLNLESSRDVLAAVVTKPES